MRIKQANWFFLLVTILPFAYMILVPMTGIELPVWLQLSMGELLILAAVLLYCVLFRRPLRSFIPHKSLSMGTVGWIILFTIVTSPLITVVNLLSQFLVENEAGTLTDILQDFPFAAMFGIIAVLPAVIEETAFRGILFQNYREGGVWKGILLSALLFGLMHMNLNQMLYALVLGILMALLVEATNSIYASMLMHFLINGSNVWIMYQSMQLQAIDPAISADPMEALGVSYNTFLAAALVVYGIFAVIGVLIAIPVYKKIAASSGRADYIHALFHGNVRPYEKHRLITVPLVIGVVLSVAFIVYDTLSQMGIV